MGRLTFLFLSGDVSGGDTPNATELVGGFSSIDASSWFTTPGLYKTGTCYKQRLFTRTPQRASPGVVN
mgnify:CR=1 FL=1